MSPWIASNSTVIKTPDGVHFGTYADGGAVGGSMVHKVSGMKLSDVEDYSFTFNYKQAGNLSGATPYARIFLDTDHNGTTDADVILDPSKGGLVTPEQSVDQTFGTDDDSVRYDDDAGSSAQQSWSDVKQAHGDDKIVSILVSQGYSMGTDVSAMVKTVRFNGVCYKFNVAPRDGSDGEDGTNGTNGTDGTNGHDGANGSAGSNGTNGRNGVDGAAGVNGQDGKNAGSTTIVNDRTADLQGARRHHAYPARQGYSPRQRQGDAARQGHAHSRSLDLGRSPWQGRWQLQRRHHGEVQQGRQDAHRPQHPQPEHHAVVVR